ncbi:MAG TPA: TolC family protein [Vicinamibacteria bacterium]|nr:TolC family protein [Vicinamibacteria bacterium]
MSGNLCVVLMAAALPAAAQEVLTLESVLQRTRESAPAVQAARARIEEARARRIGAAARLSEKPAISASAGPRERPGSSFVDVDVGVEQLFEIGGQRGARISAAEALIDREMASSEAVLREALREGGSAFLNGLAARDRLELARAAFTNATELLEATRRRYELGDVAAIDLNLARIVEARTRANAADASAEKLSAEGRLRALLSIGSEVPIVLEGDLAELGRRDADGLLAQAGELPELRAIAAEARAAEAEVRLGNAETHPDLGMTLDYEREEGDDVLRFGGILTLPWTNTGKSRRAEAEARGRRLALELAGARAATASGLRTAHEVYRARVEAAEAMTTGALPSVLDNEALAARSYEAGEIGLLALLLLRREAFDARVSTIERNLEAAEAAIDLELAAGVLR